MCVWGWGGTAVAMQVWVRVAMQVNQPNVQKNSRALVRGWGDLNFEKKMLEINKVHT